MCMSVSEALSKMTILAKTYVVIWAELAVRPWAFLRPNNMDKFLKKIWANAHKISCNPGCKCSSLMMHLAQ